MAPKLNAGPETLRKWVTQAQADTRELTGPTSDGLDKIKRLKWVNEELRDINDILKAVTSFFSSGSSTLTIVHSFFHRQDEGRRPRRRADLLCPARAGCAGHVLGLSGLVRGRKSRDRHSTALPAPRSPRAPDLLDRQFSVYRFIGNAVFFYDGVPFPIATNRASPVG